MIDKTLLKAVDILLDSEIAEFNKLSCDHRFSLRHKLKMRKIFRLYEKNAEKIYSESREECKTLDRALAHTPRRPVPLSKAVRLAVMIIFLAALSIAVAGSAYRGFNQESYKDHTAVFAANIDSAPKTLERLYGLTDIPEGFELTDKAVISVYSCFSYDNIKTDDWIVFQQKQTKRRQPKLQPKLPTWN